MIRIWDTCEMMTTFHVYLHEFTHKWIYKLYQNSKFSSSWIWRSGRSFSWLLVPDLIPSHFPPPPQTHHAMNVFLSSPQTGRSHSIIAFAYKLPLNLERFHVFLGKWNYPQNSLMRPTKIFSRVMGIEGVEYEELLVCNLRSSPGEI